MSAAITQNILLSSDHSAPEPRHLAELALLGCPPMPPGDCQKDKRTSLRIALLFSSKSQPISGLMIRGKQDLVLGGLLKEKKEVSAKALREERA